MNSIHEVFNMVPQKISQGGEGRFAITLNLVSIGNQNHLAGIVEILMEVFYPLGFGEFDQGLCKFGTLNRPINEFQFAP